MPPVDARRALLREHLVLAFLPVVEHLARRHGRDSATREELTQVGTVALITRDRPLGPALAHGEFLGYLVPCVRGEMLRWFRDRTWSMRVPRRLKELSVGRRQGDRAAGAGARPRAAAQRVGRAAAASGSATSSMRSTCARTRPRGRSTASTPCSVCPSPSRSARPTPNLEKVEYQHALRPLLDALPERERMILTLRFFGEMTQTQIGQRLGISQMHVSRILARTLKQLRAALTAED